MFVFFLTALACDLCAAAVPVHPTPEINEDTTKNFVWNEVKMLWSFETKLCGLGEMSWENDEMTGQNGNEENNEVFVWNDDRCWTSFETKIIFEVTFETKLNDDLHLKRSWFVWDFSVENFGEGGKILKRSWKGKFVWNEVERLKRSCKSRLLVWNANEIPGSFFATSRTISCTMVPPWS